MSEETLKQLAADLVVGSDNLQRLRDENERLKSEVDKLEYTIAQLKEQSRVRERDMRARFEQSCSEVERLRNVEGAKYDSIKKAIHDVLNTQIGDSFDCTRTWSAWSARTMREDDFIAVLDRIDDITEEVAKAVSQALSNKEQT